VLDVQITCIADVKPFRLSKRLIADTVSGPPLSNGHTELPEDVGVVAPLNATVVAVPTGQLDWAMVPSGQTTKPWAG
jgi:hypothetical protein